MSIPTIGGARGIFEILVPGAFVMINLIAAVYLLPFTDNATRDFITAGASNQLPALVIGVIFSYLIGIILRLLRVPVPDEWAAKWLRKFRRKARKKDGTFKLYTTEKFPYIGWLGETLEEKNFPPAVLKFYKAVWKPRKVEGQENIDFFNFCKVMIIPTTNDKCADEIYAAEALSRYVAGMFYALVFIFCLLLVTAILRFIFLGEMMMALVIILLAYLVAIIVILANFRFVRVKEVATVFAASFKYKSLFESETLSLPEQEVLPSSSKNQIRSEEVYKK